ncbi:MAG: hypothetical protein U0074_05280 [Kouleothrix sp.]
MASCSTLATRSRTASWPFSALPVGVNLDVPIIPAWLEGTARVLPTKGLPILPGERCNLRTA